MAGYAIDHEEGRGWRLTRTRADQGRSLVDLTTTLGLERSRARLWRYPPGASGVPHVELEQEEVFVVLAGILTLVLGDPPERNDLPPGSVCAVRPGTAIRVRNDGAEDATFFAYGAPPVADAAEILPG